MAGQLSKQLTLHQLQAYQGARTFYRCFIPLVMGLLLVAHLAPLITTNPDINYSAMIATIVSWVSYGFALHFYTRCNQIDTTPLLQPFTLIEASSIIADEAEDTALMLDKPPRVKCRVCDIVCDYRTKHCRKCQVCIQRFDHHCFWIGNCVGRHNHKPFFLFLLLQTANNILNSYSLYYLQQTLQSLHLSLSTTPYLLYLALQIMAAGFVVFTGYLLLYHCMLVLSGITTWQHMRRSKISYLKYLPAGYNPFSRGVMENVKWFFAERTRYTGDQSVVDWEESIASFQEGKRIKPGFNLIDNEYYSCC